MVVVKVWNGTYWASHCGRKRWDQVLLLTVFRNSGAGHSSSWNIWHYICEYKYIFFFSFFQYLFITIPILALMKIWTIYSVCLLFPLNYLSFMYPAPLWQWATTGMAQRQGWSIEKQTAGVWAKRENGACLTWQVFPQLGLQGGRQRLQNAFMENKACLNSKERTVPLIRTLWNQFK